MISEVSRIRLGYIVKCTMCQWLPVTVISVLSITGNDSYGCNNSRVSFPDQIEADNRTNHDSDNPTSTPPRVLKRSGVTEDISIYQVKPSRPDI